MSKANHHSYKISSVIIINGKPIEFGWNDIDKTHPSMGLKRLHAELSAINRCKHKVDLSKATIVVYGENKFGDRILAKPCSCCQKHLKDAGIKKAVFSTPNGYGVLKL